jgi:hypothetical protein
MLTDHDELMALYLDELKRSGVWARATTVESTIEVLNLDRGAYAGCCLHVLPDG